MSTNKISKVQLNDVLYLLKGDADNIKEVMASIVSDLYSRIDTGSDNTTILDIIERLSNVEESKASLEQIEELWDLINNLSGKIPNSTINYFFAYKKSSKAPDRPTNTDEYPPQGWKSYPESPSSDEVIYMTMARKVNNSWQNWADGYRWTQPIAYSDKSSLILNIEGNIALYKLSLGTPTLSAEERLTKAYPTGWSTTPDFAAQGTKEVYMITAKTLNGNYVDIGGYYWSAPMRIGNGTTSGTGADGDSYNYVYYPSNSSTAPSVPNFTVAEIELSENHHIGNWYDRPQGVSATKMYEYISLSVGNDDNRKGWSTPVLWSKWGERGMDGDAVEYIYKTNDTGSVPTIPSYNPESATYQQDDYVPSGWTDNPTGVTENTPYEYVAIRKKKQEVWLSFENPVLWAKYGKDGRDGEAGVVDGYLMTCNNSSIIADDDLFTKNNALDRFNALASATFRLTKTSGESITPQYALANDSVLPAGISAINTFTNSGVLTYTGSFTNAANIKDGDVYYAHINGLVNGEVVATIKQTIYVKNFSQGESYRLIVTPTAIEVSSDNKFKSTASINVKFLVIGDVLSTDVDFNRYQLKYKVEKNGNSSTLVGNEWTSQNCTLGNANDTAANYYVVNLYKTVNSTDVLVDSQTVNTYKNGEQGILGISGAVVRYIGDWSSVIENADDHTFTFECNTPEGANVRYIDVVTMPATGGGLDYYQCKEAYPANANSLSPDLDSTHWEPAQHYKFLVTDTLIANVIAAGSISANDVVIKEGEGLSQSIVAGMTSSTAKYSALGDVRIWAGTEGDLPNILNAPFIVNNKGDLYAENATIQGNIYATNGEFNGVVNATSGLFQGNVSARSLEVLDGNGNIVMLFRPAPSGIDDIPEGTPMLFVHWNQKVYKVNMTELTGQNIETTYEPETKYVVNSGTELGESLTSTLKRVCHLRNGKLYKQADPNHYDLIAGISTTTNCYLARSTDPTKNGKLYIEVNGQKVEFTGYCLSEKLEEVCVGPSDLNNYTGLMGYIGEYYENGDLIGRGGASNMAYFHRIGTHAKSNGEFSSEFADENQETTMQSTPLYSTSPGILSYYNLKQLYNVQASISDDPAPNPGQFE